MTYFVIREPNGQRTIVFGSKPRKEGNRVYLPRRYTVLAKSIDPTGDAFEQLWAMTNLIAERAHSYQPRRNHES